MKAKALEVRDRGTFIPVLAVDMNPNDDAQRYLLRRAGYACDGRPIIMLTYMRGGERAEYDVYSWPENPRTMRWAHQYIEEHWDKLKDGDVVCVETILGERATPKTSERFGG